MLLDPHQDRLKIHAILLRYHFNAAKKQQPLTDLSKQCFQRRIHSSQPSSRYLADRPLLRALLIHVLGRAERERRLGMLHLLPLSIDSDATECTLQQEYRGSS